MAANEDTRSDATGTGVPGLFGQFRDLVTDALRYWELSRLICNGLLALIVLAHFAAAWPLSRSSITLDGVLGLFLLGVLANVAFSAVYLADVFVQFSGFHASGRAGGGFCRVSGSRSPAC
jgi:hypothetical protein